MEYRKWKKTIRKISKKMRRDMKLKRIKLILSKEHRKGAWICPEERICILSYQFMNELKKTRNLPCSLIDITTAILTHELGHQKQYELRRQTYFKKWTDLRKMYRNGMQKERGYTQSERIQFIKTYYDYLIPYEEEAWELSEAFCKGCSTCYQKVKELGIAGHKQTYQDCVDYIVEQYAEN